MTASTRFRSGFVTVPVKLLLLCLVSSGFLAGQVPRVGSIEFYGLRKTSEPRLRNILQLKQGDPLPPSKAELEERLEQVPGVVLARLEAVCCEKRDAILFVGVEEKGAMHFAFRSPPTGSALLPEELIEAHRKFLEALQEAARNGNTAEDLTQGHPLAADPDVRAFQERFKAFAKEHLTVLRDALYKSSNEEHRAIAAAIIGYAPEKRDIINDLQYAMQDPDEAVRANAMRAVSAAAVLAGQKPELEIHISPTWFIEMLNSIVLSDRNRAAAALVNLTENNAEGVLAQIRERAMPAVVEMARWKSLRFALPAYILLGRLAGLTERQIEDTWTRDERESVIARLIKPSRGKR